MATYKGNKNGNFYVNSSGDLYVGDIVWSSENGELTNTPSDSANSKSLGRIISVSPGPYFSEIVPSEYNYGFGDETAIDRIKRIVDKMEKL